jgi:Ca2+-binding EF-hand superfamily protein
MSARQLSNYFIAGVVVIMIMLLLASTAATASHHGKGKHHKMPSFADVDLNGDGAIVASEFYEVRAARMAERAKAGGKMKNAANAPTFESIDLDEDGEISPEEFAAHQADMMKKRKKKLDE